MSEVPLYPCLSSNRSRAKRGQLKRNHAPLSESQGLDCRICAIHVFVRQRSSVCEREFFIDNLLVRIHFIIEMIRWTGLAPWEFEFPFLVSLIFTFLVSSVVLHPHFERVYSTVNRPES